MSDVLSTGGLGVMLDKRAHPREIASFLDSAGHDGRRAALAALTGPQQQLLYDGAADAAPLTLDDFVPASPGAGRPVPHFGYNTLMLPAFGRAFVKWMVRREDGSVFGYNQSPFGPLIGPGYFVLRPTVGDERHHAAVVVDYYPSPSGERPAGWPWMIPNWFGLQALVYGWCHDYMRRVSDDVTIGAAFKWGRPVGSWFVLTRGPK